MEVIWKAVSGVVNFRIELTVEFYDMLQGFNAGRGMGGAPPYKTICSRSLRK